MTMQDVRMFSLTLPLEPMSLKRLHVTIKRLREAKGWNQRGLAKRARVSPGYIGLVELRQRSPSIAVLQRVAKALGVPVAELLG
jgi:transcriptional regulator with XRE-family HTH domain